jgi:hypothetical protein
MDDKQITDFLKLVDILISKGVGANVAAQVAADVISGCDNKHYL